MARKKLSRDSYTLEERIIDGKPMQVKVYEPQQIKPDNWQKRGKSQTENVSEIHVRSKADSVIQRKEIEKEQ